ncbi:MAG: serine/threonine protein kinase, partial [Planctomycetes bacterium]|nr:serine/threonine protein kinase [Planctomycetota bacterium]
MGDLSDQFEQQKETFAQLFDEAREVESQGDTDCLDSLKKSTDSSFRYDIIDTINTGGMKTVYQAFDSTTKRIVALAVIKKEALSETDIRYFVQEGWVTAQLEHPNIVPIHDIGLDAEGNPYFTMKLLCGENLSQILSSLDSGDPAYLKKYPMTRLLSIYKHICDAVSFAHSKGVVHLDLKPENIQINDFGETLVLDWGIARYITQQSEDPHLDEVLDSQLNTKEHSYFSSIRGTPGYMAPEQLK